MATIDDKVVQYLKGVPKFNKEEWAQQKSKVLAKQVLFEQFFAIPQLDDPAYTLVIYTTKDQANFIQLVSGTKPLSHKEFTPMGKSSWINSLMYHFTSTTQVTYELKNALKKYCISEMLAAVERFFKTDEVMIHHNESPRCAKLLKRTFYARVGVYSKYHGVNLPFMMLVTSRLVMLMDALYERQEHITDSFVEAALLGKHISTEKRGMCGDGSGIE